MCASISVLYSYNLLFNTNLIQLYILSHDYHNQYCGSSINFIVNQKVRQVILMLELSCVCMYVIGASLSEPRSGMECGVEVSVWLYIYIYIYIYTSYVVPEVVPRYMWVRNKI